MRSALLLLTLAPLAAASPAGSARECGACVPAARKTVAVLNFDNNSGQARYDPFGKGIAAMMITDLANVQEVQVVERERVQDLVEEMRLQQSHYFDPETAQRIGRLAGAEYVVAGSLAAVDPRIRLDTRVIRVETGEIVKTAEVTGREDRFFELQQKLAAELIDGLALALSPEELERFHQQQEANRIEEMQTALAFSRALDLFDREDYVGAVEAMYPVVQAAPQSTLVRLTYDRMKERAADQARRDLRNRARGLLRGRVP